MMRSCDAFLLLLGAFLLRGSQLSRANSSAHAELLSIGSPPRVSSPRGQRRAASLVSENEGGRSLLLVRDLPARSACLPGGLRRDGLLDHLVVSHGLVKFDEDGSTCGVDNCVCDVWS